MQNLKEFLKKRSGENSSRVAFIMFISSVFGLGFGEQEALAISTFIGGAISLVIMFIPDKGNA